MIRHELRLIHLQLTKKCNLRCPFCGQWGEAGYMEGDSAADLSIEDWLRAVDQAVCYREETGVAPEFILWGGEPLLSRAFEPVSDALQEANFRTALITNGALLEKNAEVINRNIKTLYVSIDGPAEIHNRLRHSSHLFEKIEHGISRIDSKVLRVVLFTLCGENYHAAADFPFLAARLGFDQVIFQNLIYCTPAQARDYRQWLKTSFGQDAPHLASWICEEAEAWTARLPEVTARLQTEHYPIPVEIYPSEIHANNITQWFDALVSLKIGTAPCLMPYRHLHINHDGNAHFCVDFNDFTLGNIRSCSISELFNNDLARRFREESPKCNTLCARCPWYYNKTLKIDTHPQ